jgi:hypothetical protein
LQEQVANHRKRLGAKAPVVSDMATHLRAELVLDALTMAFQQRAGACQ